MSWENWPQDERERAKWVQSAYLASRTISTRKDVNVCGGVFMIMK
jgi:hypothetical protein